MERGHVKVTMMLAAALSAVLFGAGCGPDYPNCDTDEDCHEGEFCVNGQCQQCRDDNDCPAGQQCNGGRCDEIPGYCTSNADCPAGQECRDNRCSPIEGFCNSASDCPAGQECENNHCVASAAPAAECELAAVYFGFDSSELSSQSRDVLQSDRSCIEERNLSGVQVIGHTDPRGTEEYNLALGDRRAQAVVRYLQSLGVARDTLRASSMGEEMASGADESGWSRDRRVEVQAR
jgi:peptidoglycan-associated lipoprotein